MKNQKISVRELLDKNSNISTDRSIDFSKTNFWHYTTMNAAKSIVNSLEFHCGTMSNCNDRIEANRHKNECDSIHVMCFCHSGTEQIPHWYLYSGLKGQGAAIKITPSTMISLIKSIETVKTPDEKLLHKGIDFDLLYGWVYYVKHSMDRLESGIVDSDRNTAGVMYKGSWYDIDDWQGFIKDNYFVKDYPWQYEKEFRIVIKNKTPNKYKKLIVQWPNIPNGIDVKFAPGVPNTEPATINICGKEKAALRSDLDIQWNFNQ